MERSRGFGKDKNEVISLKAHEGEPERIPTNGEDFIEHFPFINGLLEGKK